MYLREKTALMMKKMLAENINFVAPNFFVRTVNDSEQSFATRLKAKREALFLSRKTAAAELKILEKFITAMEEDIKELLPANIYTINALRRYAIFLKEDPELIVQLFKKARGISLVNEPYKFVDRRPMIKIRARFLQYAASVIFGLAVLGYLFYKTFVITSPPEIVVYEPAEKIIVSTPIIMVRGKTDPSVNVKINGQSVSLATDGQFNQELVLGTGVNVIKISGAKRYSRERIVIRQITVSGGKNLGFSPVRSYQQ